MINVEEYTTTLLVYNDKVFPGLLIKAEYYEDDVLKQSLRGVIVHVEFHYLEIFYVDFKIGNEEEEKRVEIFSSELFNDSTKKGWKIEILD